ncbi:IclR family transcriptional regulator [Nocardia rhizosphaerihabitans]|uniref:IclR family transcriptional regulator n=1 Tax=Nocardia rhizosphaerihabitans TaxID=1691570 RepID=A0ABQ2L262_9NOCA|nr:IclR family transcriptional regulator [Nocardia rhizosphaerihabitans]GGN99976.1 IclR family transcriptional regulator [Nocardia rhizosphaerihabitans]
MTIPHPAVSARHARPVPRSASIQVIDPRDRPERDPSTSVAKALALLSSFTPQHPTMGVSEIARRAQLPKSTAHRLLSVLVEWEMVTKRGTEYSPGGRLNELAALAAQPDTQDLRRVALPHLLDLYEMTHETVNLCVLAGEDVLYVDKIHGHNCVDSPARVGARLPATNTAVGKAILAFSTAGIIARVADNLRPATSSSIASPTQLAHELAAIRRVGIAYDRQETRPGLTCIAAPVQNWSGAIVAAISISGPVQRFQPTNATPAIRAAAAGIAKLAQQASWQRHLGQ